MLESRKYYRDGLNHSTRHSRKNFLKEGCCRSATKPNRTTQEVLNEFSQNTTLLGISHAIRNKSICWSFAYICCLIFSIVQTWSTAAEFFEKKSHQSFGVKNRMLMPFPSVTICNNILLPLALVNNDTVKNYTPIDLAELNRNFNESEDEIEKLEYQNKIAVIKFVRRLTPETRKRYSVPIDEWLVKCQFQYHDCNRSDTKLFHEFSHPYHGTCLTFNPAYKGLGAEVDIDSKLTLTLKRKGIGYQIYSGRPRISVLVHSPGTTPLVDLPETIDIYGGQFVDIGLRLACMKTCVQKEINQPCGILDATFPILDDYELERKEKFEIPPIQACEKTQERDLSMENCGCPFPCEIFQYTPSIDTTDLIDGTSSGRTENNNVPVNDSESKVEKMRVSVQFLSNIFDHIHEELDYNLPQFMGILGGNLSLWLGLCVLSLLELIELAWNLVAIQIRNYFNKHAVNNVIKNPDIPTFRKPYIENLTNYNSKRHGILGLTRNPFKNMKVDERVSVVNSFRPNRFR